MKWTLVVTLLIVCLRIAGCVGPSATPAPAAEPLVLADFESCLATDNLGGPMGAAFDAPDSLVETYVHEATRGCVARLEWRIAKWAGYWLALKQADFSKHRQLDFDIRADGQKGIPDQIKVELKRDNQVGVIYVKGIGQDWKTISVPFEAFGYAGYGDQLAAWTGMQELVFVVESDKSGPEGLLFIDNVIIR